MRFSALIVSLIIGASIVRADQAGVIDNSSSPHVTFRSIGIGDCRWTDGFWAEKFQLCQDVMVPHMGSLLKGDVGHAYNNFKIAAGLKDGPHQGMHWHDGDFYKWMESAVYVYAINRDEKILVELDEIIDVIGKAQLDNGYLSTQIQLGAPEPWTARNYHELYNSGHLLTSACIHHRVTGKRNFLDIAIKHADHLYETFQPQPERLARFGFNQTQIMGLVELYRTTGDKRYLRLAEIFINMRGRSRVEPGPSVRHSTIGDMVQERKPLRKETEAVGHAVLALYFYAGAADVYAETGERALVEALDRLWENVVHKKMYITGACGQTHHGASSRGDAVHEAFAGEYVMPNLTAYNETCANLCNAMFSHRMLGIHGESKYADIMELVMLNSGLSGISVDGRQYFYSNPLRSIHGARDYSALNTETPDRQPYLKCFCCPPNLVRTIAKLSSWAYSLPENGVAVNLYGANELETRLCDGSTLRLRQETAYPWDGAIKITVQQCKSDAFDVHLRIPDWADAAQLRINGTAADVVPVAGQFAVLTRKWKPGDVIELDLPMQARLMVGHPRIEEVRNQAAVQRGPVVYCIESPDLPKDTSILDVNVPSDIEWKLEPGISELGNVTALRGTVLLRSEDNRSMYRVLDESQWQEYEARFVPYHAWSNRGLSEMTVWMPIVWR
ncbi:glycoside hydrolase family 127 protein [Crateriforma spongiae]|uniref:glycoside hydrolase family 127 protein n=1 Tax=Crateriforma spongiae TaxID=2724528 RepID=UPI0028F41FEF|nr:beta-L-arabinofuranosidase domain-containing protein [Crateriforma spongiae]